MEWLYPKRRAPEWKRGWTGQSMSSISAPSLHFLMIFGIVITLLWFSQYTDYRTQLHRAAINFHVFLLLLPILLIFLIVSYSTSGRLNFRLTHSEHDSLQRAAVSFSPLSVAILVLLLLVLLWYQSSFQSKWFGLWRSD